MARTLITGANGFTGRYLAPLLEARGHAVHGIVHDADGGTIPGVAAVHTCDLADVAGLAAVAAAVRPTHVVHMAAIAFVAHGDVAEMYATNIVGTRSLLDALASADAVPDAVLVASSANIYGNAREGVLDEDTPADPPTTTASPRSRPSSSPNCTATACPSSSHLPSTIPVRARRRISSSQRSSTT